MSLDFEVKKGYYRLKNTVDGWVFIVGNPSDEDNDINSFIVLEVLEGVGPVPYKLQIEAFKRLDDLVQEYLRGRWRPAA